MFFHVRIVFSFPTILEATSAQQLLAEYYTLIFVQHVNFLMRTIFKHITIPDWLELIITNLPNNFICMKLTEHSHPQNFVIVIIQLLKNVRYNYVYVS